MTTNKLLIYRSIYDIDCVSNKKAFRGLGACNFELVLNSSYHIKVHKQILSRVAYFSAACNFQENDAASMHIRYEPISCEDFEKVVSYFYTNEIKLDERCVRQVYKFSHYIGVEGLVRLCGDYCEENFSLSNVWHWNSFAREAMINELERKTEQYMGANFEKFTVDLQLLKSFSVENVKKLLSLNDLRVTSEAKILQLVFNYSKNFEVDNTISVFKELASSIRFKFITNSQIESFCCKKSNMYVEAIKSLKNCEEKVTVQNCRVYSKGIYIIEENYVYPEIYM